MRIFTMQVIALVLNACTFACLLVVQGSSVASVELPGFSSNADLFISIAPSPEVPEQSNGTNLQPPLITIPSPESAPAPETTADPILSLTPSTSSIPPPLLPFGAPPTPFNDDSPPMSLIPPESSVPPPFTPQVPAPATSPPNEPAMRPSPPVSHETTPPPLPPVLNAPPTKRMPPSPRPSQSALPEEPPPLPPVVSTPPASPENSPPPDNPILPEQPPSSPPVVSSPPALPINFSPPDEPLLPEVPPASPPVVLTPPALPINFSPPEKPLLPGEPPSSPPEQNHMIAPPSPSIIPEKAPGRLPSPANKTDNAHAPVSRSPSKDHSATKPPVYPPKENHHAYQYKISPAPLSHMSPPTLSEPPVTLPRKKSDVNLRHDAPPPALADNPNSPVPASSPLPRSASFPKVPKIPLPPPLLVFPPPPPHKDCGPLTCYDPLTYGPPESPCICVLPIQVGLRLSVALYTFFPLVTELAAEISAGVFLKQSQVRIMGANAATDNSEKTIVLVDLIPLAERFDDTTALFTFQRLWQKQVLINKSIFGDYDVLYVRYPGLPPSPPLPPSTISIIGSKPYPGNGNNAGIMKPIGVDARINQHKDGLSGSVLGTIIFSAFVAAILLCVLAWVFLFKHRHCETQSDPTPPNIIPSLAKSSTGIGNSIIGSGPSSPPFSLGSSIAAYTGSAKAYSSSDIERATDFFNEMRILGEGGFGRVYSGLLDDGTEVAMKVLKRCDQQGGREFFAEVEMLSRLHHRNLVKLIGICTEERTRCLIYELVPNGSVESHLHGIDKETAPLDWNARLKIALGAARALAYLHEDSSPRVIHRDFKASNILLEDDFTPKVSDFGLARSGLDEANNHVSTRVMGTFGYVAPEYAMTGHLLVKSDVYSYGVVLLELLSGKKPIDMTQPAGQENLVAWARPLLTSQQGLESLTDPALGPDFPFESIAKVSAIASMCVQPEVSHRPFMGEVVQALKLVSNECDEIIEMPSTNFAGENLDNESISSIARLDPLLTPSTICDYDYRLDVERDLSMSGLLSSSAKFGEGDDCESFRRHSSSGPLRIGKSKHVWQSMRKVSGGSVSEHGMFRFWSGSH